MPPLSMTEALIAQQHWAMQQLLHHCAALPAATLEYESGGGFGTIRATLQHIVANDLGYLQRIDGRRPTPEWDGSEDVAQLLALNDWIAASWRELLQTLPADYVVHETAGTLWCRYPLHGLLLQAFQHGCEHRSQICSTLTQYGISAPDLSGWEWLVAADYWAEGDTAQSSVGG
jgi:uncharacterized damage-inducible protein DinB